MEDRRVFARIAAQFPLRFLDPHSGKDGEAETTDISANGVGFVTGENLRLKVSLEMWLEIPDKQAPLYTRGEVVWLGPIGEANQCRVGVQLEKAQLMGLARTLWIKK